MNFEFNFFLIPFCAVALYGLISILNKLYKLMLRFFYFYKNVKDFYEYYSENKSNVKYAIQKISCIDLEEILVSLKNRIENLEFLFTVRKITKEVNDDNSISTRYEYIDQKWWKEQKMNGLVDQRINLDKHNKIDTFNFRMLPPLSKVESNDKPQE